VRLKIAPLFVFCDGPESLSLKLGSNIPTRGGILLRHCSSYFVTRKIIFHYFTEQKAIWQALENRSSGPRRTPTPLYSACRVDPLALSATEIEIRKMTRSFLER
jgi:hypothetical protein